MRDVSDAWAMAMNTSRVDRSADCRRCGKTGHKAKDCVAEAEEAMAFRSLLAKESQEAHSQLK